MLTFKPAPPTFEVLPVTVAVKLGLNASAAQLVTWNGTDSDDAAPSMLCRAAVIDIGSQLVGLNVNPWRVIVTLTCLICSGMPLISGGIAYGPELSLVIVSAAVSGSTWTVARTMTLPRWNGPASAGLTIESPNGAPL